MPVISPSPVSQELSHPSDDQPQHWAELGGNSSDEDEDEDEDDADNGSNDVEGGYESASFEEYQKDASDYIVGEQPSFLGSDVDPSAEKTISKRAYYSLYDQYKKSLKKSMQRPTGAWHNPIRRPKIKRRKSAASGKGKEDVTLETCISEMPRVLSTCMIDREPGTVYAQLLTDNIKALGNATDRTERMWAYYDVADTLRKITESRCNIHPLCRDHQWKWDHFLRNSKHDRPDITIDWESFATSGILADKRPSLSKRKQAEKDGEKLGDAAYSLKAINCTIGDKTASVFVQLTQDQMTEIDGNPHNATNLEHYNITITDAMEASCPGWKDQKTFVEKSQKAYRDIVSGEPSENVEGRYTVASAVDQMERRKESLAPSSFPPGSLAIAAAAATAGLSYGLSLVT